MLHLQYVKVYFAIQSRIALNARNPGRGFCAYFLSFFFKKKSVYGFFFVPEKSGERREYGSDGFHITRIIF